ncbi:hypothetical protein GALL_544100 [mine drainage metagenome]|uniref:Uncharacterized protein n=1 Tax=mine drainage metagenome TaxID=410659 RepID=A0A1J5PFL0_9ZZZZ
MGFVHTGFLLQPAHQFGFVFFLDELQHDGILSGLVKRQPCFAKVFIFGQDGTGGVAFKFLAFGVFKVELHRTA